MCKGTRGLGRHMRDDKGAGQTALQAPRRSGALKEQLFIASAGSGWGPARPAASRPPSCTFPCGS
eukprot:3018458-Pyramimonas_sp.AAC.1